MFFTKYIQSIQHTQQRHPFSLAFLLAITLVMLLGMMYNTAYAFEARSGAAVVIPANETIAGDIYLTGRRIDIAGTVQGDVIAAAADIIISGQVTGDVMAAGRSVTISGTVGDDARITGAILRVLDGADIGGDVVASGYSLEVAGGSVAGDLVFGGRQAILAGNVTGDVRLAADAAQLRGSVGGDASLAVSAGGDFRPPNQVFGDIEVPFVASGLDINASSNISGNTEISTTAELADNVQQQLETITSGNVNADIRTRTRSFDLLALLTRFISFALLGILLAWRAPYVLQRSETLWRNRPLASFGWGALGVFAMPLVVTIIVALVVALAALFGWLTLGTLAGLVALIGSVSAVVIGVVFALLVFFVTPLVSGYAAGRLILRQPSSDTGGSDTGGISVARATPPLLLGLLVLGALALVPVVGGVITFIATTLGLGSIWLAWRQRPVRSA
jgi:cytoskeletal protein CcmA (bactofilin family)